MCDYTVLVLVSTVSSAVQLLHLTDLKLNFGLFSGTFRLSSNNSCICEGKERE